MRKKFVVALVAAMSLTVAGTGTVFAMDKVSTIASEKEHVHGDNCEWVVDKEAWDETVHHPAEYKTVHHPAEYKTVHHPAEYDTIHHPEEGHYEIRTICHNCGADISGHASEHLEQNFENGCLSYGDKEVWIVDKAAWDEQVLIKDAWDEQVLVKDAWDEQVLIKDAWDEQVLVKDAWDEQVLVKEAWDEIVHHPEEGHWVCNGEPQKPEQKPENPDQKPEQPENPDQKPEQPENPDVETPETPDAENPATPEQKPDANKENVQTQETETKKEGTSPKTGDTASALPVAGAGLASLGVALATILKKRK